MLFSLRKHYSELYRTDIALKVSRSCSFSQLLHLMVLKTLSPGCGVRASVMLFLKLVVGELILDFIDHWLESAKLPGFTADTPTRCQKIMK